MPIGTRHNEDGLLLRDGWRLYLRLDGGGAWEVDAGLRGYFHVGHRVRIEGVRAGFDLLDVKRLERL